MRHRVVGIRAKLLARQRDRFLVRLSRFRFSSPEGLLRDPPFLALRNGPIRVAEVGLNPVAVRRMLDGELERRDGIRVTAHPELRDAQVRRGDRVVRLQREGPVVGFQRRREVAVQRRSAADVAPGAIAVGCLPGRLPEHRRRIAEAPASREEGAELVVGRPGGGLQRNGPAEGRLGVEIVVACLS